MDSEEYIFPFADSYDTTMDSDEYVFPFAAMDSDEYIFPFADSCDTTMDSEEVSVPWMHNHEHPMDSEEVPLPWIFNHEHPMDSEEVSVPWIFNQENPMDFEEATLPLMHNHKHPMMPLNDMRKGDCCGRFEATSDGYYCKECDFFFHKRCADESSRSIQHLSHPYHTFDLQSNSDFGRVRRSKPGQLCSLCGNWIKDLYYSCKECGSNKDQIIKFRMDLCCAKYPPPKVIDNSEMHHHKLTLVNKLIKFDCDAKCGIDGYGFPYKFLDCDLAFHVDCVWHPVQELKQPLEVTHSYHSLHPLKLHTKSQLPNYCERQCRLCARIVDDRLFYHCSLCNFTLDMRCVLNPPLRSLLNLKVHDHQLTLLPRLDSFTCNACGLKGDRSPYACFVCGFMIHQDCLDLPHVININRHDHRVSRTPVLGVVNSVCGVCYQKVDWTCGGFSCQKCPDFVVHAKCATREDVWNGKELEGVPEETEDIEPYVVIDDNTIQHFSHKEHPLRLHVNGILIDDNKRCRACTHPICLQSFYWCSSCDFILHENCAGFLRKKRHFLHNERLTLVTETTDLFNCDACSRLCNGFRYQHGDKTFDVQCISISEPFFHPSHLDHPLYYASQPNESKSCNNCNKWGYDANLRCIELNCEFSLDLNCATLPLVIKHRVDDHPLSLCFGEKASGIYWCDICEKETDPRKWFYTCKDQKTSLHIKCVLGNFTGLMPRSTVFIVNGYFEVVLNNSVSRPICRWCEFHCIYPIILKKFQQDLCICSHECWLLDALNRTVLRFR